MLFKVYNFIILGPRVKPVFVRASDRMTVQERERKVKQQKKEEVEARKEKEERRRDALKLVEETIRSEQRNIQVCLYYLNVFYLNSEPQLILVHQIYGNTLLSLNSIVTYTFF